MGSRYVLECHPPGCGIQGTSTVPVRTVYRRLDSVVGKVVGKVVGALPKKTRTEFRATPLSLSAVAVVGSYAA